MNKNELLDEIKKAKENINVLEDKVKALEEPKPVKKTGRVLHVDYLKDVGEFYIVYPHLPILSECKVFDRTSSYIEMGYVFYDRKSAENHRYAIRLAQKCRLAMAESWDGEEIDWNDADCTKFCFKLEGENNLNIALYYKCYCPFPFKEYDHAQAFIEKHGEDAVINMVLNY